jgi:hypothetical protein
MYTVSAMRKSCKIEPATSKPTMKGYRGEYNGVTYSSLHRNLYRVAYKAMLAGRVREFTEHITGDDIHHVRSRVRPYDIRGGIDIELVAVLTEYQR